MIALGIGDLNLDRVTLLPEYPREGTKVQPHKVENSIGGPVPAALILLAKLDVTCYLLASVGDDEAGAVLKRKLQREQVTLLAKSAKRTKIHNIIVNQQTGSRTIIKDCVKNQPLENISAKLIQQADIIIFDRHEPKAFREVLVKKRPETKLIVDPSTEVSAKTLEMIRNSEYPIIPIESLAKLRKYEDIIANLEAFYQETGKPVVVTAGGQGTILYDGKTTELFPAFQVKVVDTLGAGDIYRGAFSYGLLHQWELKRTIEFANLVAGLQCTKVGNSSAIPSRQEIFSFMEIAKKQAPNLPEVLGMTA